MYIQWNIFFRIPLRDLEVNSVYNTISKEGIKFLPSTLQRLSVVCDDSEDLLELCEGLNSSDFRGRIMLAYSALVLFRL